MATAVLVVALIAVWPAVMLAYVDPGAGRMGAPRRRRVLVAALVALGIVASCYVVPTLIEAYLSPRVGPFVAYVVFGDLLGCAVISVMRWRLGVGLYLGLTIAEGLWFQTRPGAVAELVWLSDLVPALVLVAMAWKAWTAALLQTPAPPTSSTQAST